MSNDITVLGIDLAKDVFQLHGTDKNGKTVLKKRLTRSKLIEFVSNLKPCLIGMEACGGSHYWARLFQSFGHMVKLMAPQFVKPYVKSNKNDMNDAEGINEAVTRPSMRFVSIKSESQQETLALHKAREQMKKQRTALANQMRGLLAEFGVVIKKGISKVKKLTEILDSYKDKLSQSIIETIERLLEIFKSIDKEVQYYEKKIESQIITDPICKEILKISGVGVLTCSALTASIGNASDFKNGREVSAWLGLTPKQHSSGNKVRLGGISKRGDKYLRSLLVHGARSELNRCADKIDKKSEWAKKLKDRCGHNKACVALANKNARIIWAIMSTGECYNEELTAA